MYLYELLASGSLQRGIKLFGPSFDSEGPAAGVTSVEEILVKAERAQPKPTAENPLYANFGKRKKGDLLGSGRQQEGLLCIYCNL